MKKVPELLNTMKRKIYTDKNWEEIRGLLKWSVQLQGEIIDGKLFTTFTSDDFIEEASNFLMEEQEAMYLYRESLKCTDIPTTTFWYAEARVKRYKATKDRFTSDSVFERKFFVMKRLQELGQIGYRRVVRRKYPIYVLFSVLIVMILIGVTQALILIKTRSQ